MPRFRLSEFPSRKDPARPVGFRLVLHTMYTRFSSLSSGKFTFLYQNLPSLTTIPHLHGWLHPPRYFSYRAAFFPLRAESAPLLATLQHPKLPLRTLKTGGSTLTTGSLMLPAKSPP